MRGETIARVEAAIARLGFVRDIAAANLAKQRSYRFVFIIPGGPNTFMRTLEAQAVEAGRRAALDRIAVDVVSVPPFDGAALAAALDAIDTLTELTSDVDDHVRDWATFTAWLGLPSSGNDARGSGSAPSAAN